ncbi:Undecaprenyl-phosphate galactose phosphotransferase [Halothece sp. PCC 7418]|uniref:sugar transferase n=1 Tax=Halothece sp. (strain PCC 7418) TaxID=65093 RepID=UPI0002A067E4|nr:sugar transferase [Halothece sp. PCC 7418]AFZ45507.1 Undecaprenyl-phosphate galactose phosphotransferase [Halothece sp. PCC 7418]
MTAQSQLISVKVLRGAIKRSVDPFVSKNKYKTIALVAKDGEVFKRLFDILFSLAVLVLCSPLYLLLAILIKLSSPGPVFYIQERIGKNYRAFRCIKFRTMVNNADAMMDRLMLEYPELREEYEENFKLKDDPRVTPVGKFLRYTSLDELPQFWNVLRGDMSVVGPRPLVPEELYKYGRHIDKILTIRPGITGLWQVSGRNDIPYERRVNMDVYYVNFRNWLLDFWVIIKTIGVILFPQDNGGY